MRNLFFGRLLSLRYTNNNKNASCSASICELLKLLIYYYNHYFSNLGIMYCRFLVLGDFLYDTFSSIYSNTTSRFNTDSIIQKAQNFFHILQLNSEYLVQVS